MKKIFVCLVITSGTFVSQAQSGLHPQWESEHVIAYYDRSGDVWSYDMKSSDRKKVLKGSQPSPNPVNRDLYAVRMKTNGSSAITLVNVRSGEKVVIADDRLSNLNSFHPIWSKDGKKLAFHAENAEMKVSRLFIYDYKKRKLNAFLENKYVSAPSFFANGDILLSIFENEISTIIRFNSRTNQVTELLKSSDRIFFTDASPTSDKAFVYCSKESGNVDIWLFDIATGEKKQLTKSSNDEWTPRWSPSGNRIAYFAHIDGIYQAWVMDSDGANKININN
ncbi:MAG: hypothetical protein ABJG47_15555 [Ekhidna sp.]